MSVRYRCRAVGAVGGLRPDEWGWSLTSRRRKRRRERPCMCLCTVYGSHRVHLFKNQKHYRSLFSFIIKVFAKTRNYKKNHSLFQLCTLRQRCLICFSASCRLLTLSGLVSPSHAWEKLYPGGSLWTSKPEGCASQYTRIYIWIYRKQVMSAHLTLGVQAGIWRISRNKRHTSSSVPSLKTLCGVVLTLFQSHFRLSSFNETITIACAVCFCAIVPEKPAFCSTLDLNQREEGEVEPSGRDGWPGPSLRRALGFHQHWEAPPSPTPSSALLSTCLVLEITSSPPPSDFLRFIIVILSHTDSKATGARVKSTSQSRILGQKELN